MQLLVCLIKLSSVYQSLSLISESLWNMDDTETDTTMQIDFKITGVVSPGLF